MNLRQLEIFTAVADLRSMTRAASRLYISQPAVSNAIRDLEASLGLQLFDRVDNRLRLNPAGVAFRARAERLLKDYAALADFGQTAVPRLPLRIGTSLTLGQVTLPAVMAAFTAAHPELRVRLYAENVAAIKRRLADGDIDVAFIEGSVVSQAYAATRLSTTELMLVAAPGRWPHGRLSARELGQAPLLLREPGSTLRDVFEATAHRLGQDVEPLMESTNTAVLLNAAVAGLGATVLPAPLARPALAEGLLVALALPRGLTMATQNYAVTLRGGNRGALIQELIDAFAAATAE
ncbi:LysR family transcriptional regulator [Lacticaseibacillus kribbianus]|uniref:LysR family transcriptional regulator n=1 Tax=Lacticaseibacillus kribbianus TaxID=2926292 RepID=UPI001CD19D18|nr:LysR family transcriptional regulator [Lacticaseibacillus kribbianus]